MSFLPVVQRELLAAARRRSTFRVRWWAAVVAIVVTAVSMFFISLGPGPGAVGKSVFVLLITYAFGCSLLSGVLLTSDSLSQEKRDGTLGLLFLTELKGYDVVLGKFVALSLAAFYAVLALLPVTAFPVILGGVTGGEFWRSALAITNALFFSQAAGMLVSACARDSGRAMGATFLLLLVFSATVWISRLGPGFSFLTWTANLSPVAPLLHSSDAAYAARQSAYWRSLGLSFGIGCAFLALASFGLPGAWQQGRSWSSRRFTVPFIRRPRIESIEERSRLLDRNPVLWLCRKDLSLRLVAWEIVLVGMLISVLPVLLTPSATLARSAGPFVFYSHYGLRACGFLLKCLVAVQTCRFFAEARRTGSLELLLSTPLSQNEILRGQSMAFRRIFLAPMVAFIVLSLLPAVLAAIPQLGGSVSGLMTASAGFVFSLFITGSLALSMAADIFAVVVFGRWLALSSPRPHLAAAMTILFVLVLPSFAFCGLYLVVDLVLVLYASAKLRGDFRITLARAQSTKV